MASSAKSDLKKWPEEASLRYYLFIKINLCKRFPSYFKKTKKKLDCEAVSIISKELKSFSKRNKMFLIPASTKFASTKYIVFRMQILKRNLLQLRPHCRFSDEA